MKKIFIGIIGTVLFFGCAGVSDIYKDLSNRYMYVDEASKYKYIIFKKANSITEQESNTIPCTILEYKFNQNFIIAKIKFHYDINYGTVGFKESKRLEEGKIYYYIINTVKNIRYGEFDTYKKFNKRLEVLKVDLSL